MCHFFFSTEWSKQKEITINFAEITFSELDLRLRQFYAEARNQDGGNYSRATLLALRNGIERYLNSPPNNRGISLARDLQFVLSNKMLDAKIKQLKKDGMQNTTHKPAIELEDLEKLKNSDILSLTHPLSLLRNAWFHISLFWCRRGFEGQRSLKKCSFVFSEDAKGDCFVSMAHDEATKNHQGGISDVESFEKNARMYKTSGKTDGYTALDFFLSKLNPECAALFQYPKRNWKPSDKVWYENRPFGVNKLSTMMKDISSAAGLSRIYTNHSVRATAITLWANAGLTNREIMAISGHRNESSLQNYHNMPSVQQLRKCSNVLTVALGDDKVQPTTADQLVGNEKRPPLQQLQVPSLNTAMSSTQQNKAVFSQMFGSCTIGNVNVYNYKP